MPTFRPGSLDCYIWDSIVYQNEYRLGELGDEDIVVDVGAHIGAFSWLAAERGAGRVLGFEPCSENYRLCVANLHRCERAAVRNQAVWRSDTSTSALSYRPSEEVSNTGGGTVLHASGERVEAIALDAIISELDFISLLKLDCEGSEFPILFTSRSLDKVKEIVGEYHELGDEIPPIARVADHPYFGMPELAAALEERGFEVDYYKEHGRRGIFRASNQAWRCGTQSS